MTQHSTIDPLAPLFCLPDGCRPGEAARIYQRAGLAPVLLHWAGSSGCSCKDGAACRWPGKHPRRGAWSTAPTEASLARDWADYPYANVGLQMGGALRLVALDIDGTEGAASLAKLELELGPLPRTLTSRTGGGGSHRVLCVPPEWDLGAIKNTVGRLGPHLDIRTQGGQIVVAPSQHTSGNRYVWTDTSHPAPLPLPWYERLVELSREPAKGSQRGGATPPLAKPATRTGLGRPSDEERRSLYARAALARAADELRAASAGERNATLNNKAYLTGRFVGGGCLMRSEVEAALTEAARACGLGADEIRATLRSGLDAGVAQPRLPELPPDEPTGQARLAKASAPSTDESDDQADEPEQPSAPVARASAASWTSRLLRDGRGAIKTHLANTVLHLAESPPWAGVLAYDAFADRVIARRCPPSHEGIPGRCFPGEWRDSDDGLALEWLQREAGFDASRETVRAAVDAAAHRATVHPVRDYLTSLTWDGTPRVGSWLTRYLGATESVYTSEVGAAWLRSAVARVQQPGCKADAMLVLEGPQGARKSSALAVLGGAWFTDQLPSLDHKDSQQQLRGIWLLEMAELDALGRTEVARVKAFLTIREDRYRPSHGHRARGFPRELVFAGTCNRSDYLRDETGGRRFWPVTCGTIDLEALTRDRDQLWAEAAAQYAAGLPWWLTDPEAERQAREEQGARYQADAWEEPIGRYLVGQSRVTVAEVLRSALALDASRWGRAEQTRAGTCLVRLGWTKRRDTPQPGQPRGWHYVRPEGAEGEAEGEGLDR